MHKSLAQMELKPETVTAEKRLCISSDMKTVVS